MNLIEITPKIYQDVAQRLCGELDGEDKEGVVISWSDKNHDYKFEISFVDYSTEDKIRIVPTWWEFHTYTEGEVLNNFQFKELETYIN